MSIGRYHAIPTQDTNPWVYQISRILMTIGIHVEITMDLIASDSHVEIDIPRCVILSG